MSTLTNGSRFNLLPARELSRWYPDIAEVAGASTGGAPASIWETDTHYHLEFDMPGVHADDVDVKIREHQLHITATRPMKSDVQFIRQERPFGHLERVFKMPTRVDDSDIQAELTNGVLRIDVAKAPESQVKKIEVKAS